MHNFNRTFLQIILILLALAFTLAVRYAVENQSTEVSSVAGTAYGKSGITVYDALSEICGVGDSVK